MIIFRYLSRDVLISTFAVCFALLMIFLSVRFVSLLADAAAGKYAVNVLLEMIVYRMPGFLQIILPLGFYIAILLSYGRLYMESEMVVLFACGMSQRQLLVITLVPALFMALLVAIFSLWLGPLGMERYAKIQEEQYSRSEFDLLNAGRFQAINQGRTITYIGGISENHKQLESVFLASENPASPHPMIVSAASGEQVQHEIYGQRYLVLHDGYRYEGQPGTADFRVTHFNEFGQYMPPINLAGDYASVVDAVPTWSLLSSDDRSLRATLQWRSAMPIMVLVMTVLAISFSKTNPRQGRFMKMLPAILMFVFYFVFLSFVRGQMAQGKWPIYPGLWAVHGGFLLVGWWLFTKDKFARSRPLKLEDKTVNA